MSETSKTRYRVEPYILGNGLDIGCANDKVKDNCIGVDLQDYDGVHIIGDGSVLHWFNDASLDFVYSSHTLEDIQDTEKTLREWIRVLAIGGYLILYLPHKHFYPNIGQEHANLAHKHDFVPEDIIKLLVKIGNTRIVFNETYGCKKYIYEERGKLEYSFLIVAKKVV